MELAQDCKVVREAFEDVQEGGSGLQIYESALFRATEGRTVLKSPISFAREARSQSASTLVGSKLYTFR